MIKEDAKLRWSNVRDAIYGKLTNLRTVVKDEGTNFIITGDLKSENLILHHGIQNINSHNISYGQTYVSIKKLKYYDRNQSCIITFTDGNICLFDLNNLTQEIYKCQQAIYDLTVAEKYKKFITLCRDNSLRILGEDFSLINTIPHSGVVHGLTYNKFTHEIITYGVGFFTVWIFRTTGTILVPKKIISDRIQPCDSISCLDIEKTFSESQRCFISIFTNILVFLLQEGECLQLIKNAHTVEITDIMFFKPLKMLVSAAKDGSIKTWTLANNNTWQLNCLFIGHTAKVTSLAEYPYGPFIVSSSVDGTIRTWSLDTKDEMNCQTLDNDVLGIAKNENRQSLLFTFSKSGIQEWGIYNVYSPFTVLGAKPKSIMSSKFPFLPTQSICICDDACARIVCPVTGEIVTVFISPDYTSITDVVPVVSKDLLFTLLMDGRIVKVSCLTNPCSVLQTWTKQSTSAPSSVTCITLFEYHAPKDHHPADMDNLTEKAKPSGEKEKKLLIGGCMDGKLLIGGCMDGTIVIFNWEDEKKNGCIVFSLQAHREEVTCLAVNTGLNQLASTSPDLTLKIWRVYPFASEALAPLFMFMSHLPATHLMFAHYSLGVVFQDSSKSSYVFSMFKTENSKSAKPMEHRLQEDHVDVIMCLDSCPKMRIFATGSMDFTVRIWNNHNQLIRVLHLDDAIRSLSFCSQRGDLLLGIGSNLNFVHHKQYLPSSYLYQMVAMVFTDNQEIPPIPIEESASLTTSDQHRLFRAHCSYLKFMEFIDEVPESEQQRKRLEEEQKEKEFEILKARDDELHLLRDGLLKASHKNRPQKLTSALKKEAFKRYLDLFYDRTAVTEPRDDDYNFTDEPFVVKMNNSYHPPVCDAGFFGIKADSNGVKKVKNKLRQAREDDIMRREEAARQLLEANNQQQPKKKQFRSLSISASTVEEFKKRETARSRASLSASTSYVERLKTLKKSRREEEFRFCSDKLEKIDANASTEYPRNENARRAVNKQIIARLEQTVNAHAPNHESLPVAPDGFIPNSVVAALYRELRRESSENQKWKPRQLTEAQMAEIEKIKLKLKKTPENLDVEVSPLFSPDPSESKAYIEDEEEEEDSLPNSRILVEFNSNILDNQAPPLPTPPPPEIIEKLIAPPIRVKPKPKPIEKLVSRPKLVEKMPKPVEKPKVTATVIDVPPQRPETPLPKYILQFKDFVWFKEAYPDLNNKIFGKPTVDVFVNSLLENLSATKTFFTKFNITSAIVLLSQQKTFGDHLKQTVRDTLMSELNQPFEKPSSKSSAGELNFIRKALQLILEMGALSTMVVVELMAQYILGTPLFREEILKTFQELGLQDTKEYFPQELLTGFDVSCVIQQDQKSKLRDLCFDWLTEWTKKFRQHVISLSGKIVKKNKSNRPKRKQVERNMKDTKAKDTSHASPIDVINYFCELRFEEEVNKLKAEALKLNEEKNVVTQNKNTILIMPRKEGYVSLARVGETHRSQCHPERETSLFYGAALPPIEKPLRITSLIIRSKKINLTLFPDDGDEDDDELMYASSTHHHHRCCIVPSDLVTLRYSRKYFIPSTSFVA